MRKREIFFRVFFESAGDFLQEAAVLLIIFGILEKILAEKPISGGYASAIFVTTIMLFMIGCVCKVRRFK